jgi:hypothetical protein
MIKSENLQCFQLQEYIAANVSYLTADCFSSTLFFPLHMFIIVEVEQSDPIEEVSNSAMSLF